MALSKSIAIIVGSTRSPRVGSRVAAWIKEVVEKRSDIANLSLSLVEVADFKLPVYDESVIPSSVPERQSFAHEHSKKWSAEIAKYDAYVFVSPEYNGSTSGGAKNAIDYVKNEWTGKPIAIVTYGIFGGNKASAHLKEILETVGLRIAETRPQLPFGFGQELITASTTGELVQAVRESWEKDNVDDVVKAFEEVKTLLLVPGGQPVAP